MASSLSILLAMALIAWILVAVKLTSDAEHRVFGSSERPSTLTILIAVGVACLATSLAATPATAAACGITCIALLIAARADARRGYLFDAITLPTAILSSGIGLVAGDAAATVAGVSALVGTFGAVFIVTRGRAIGLGDVKAMFAIGAAFGPLESLLTILAACLTGIAGAAIAGRLNRGASVRFGPHLAAGSTLTLVFGRPFVHHVMGL